MKISYRIAKTPVAETHRAAYTMLELMIAVGLTSLLMIALFAAMQQYFNLQLDSNEEITRQQIARSLLRQMTRDIQSVVFVKKLANDETSGTSTSVSEGSSSSSTSGSSSTASGGSGSSTSGSSSSSTGTSGGTSSGSTSTGSTSSGSSTLDGNSYGQSSIDPETVMTTYTNGLVGTATDLQLFVSRPDKSLSYVASQDLTSTSQRSSDLMIIRYLMAQSGGGGLASAIADKESIGTDSGPIGIAKLEGDLFGLSTAVETSEESPQLAASKLLAKEVSGLQFRYYDGLTWQESWDSNALNEMPKAIEITLTLRNQEDAGDTFSDEVVDPYALPETTHRMVVPIPVAEPFVTESAL
ncbi:MAG: type II secretion system protein GspJ [Planctomycetaceae bacterium]